jgi:hypothetical protein
MSRRDQRTGDGRRYGARRRSLFSLVLTVSAGRPVFTADLYVIDGGSGKVRAVADHNDPELHWLDQANTTLQCVLPAGHADYAGKLCLTYTGSQRYLSNRAAAAWNLPHESGGFTEISVFTPTATGGFSMLWATCSAGNQNGANIYHNTVDLKLDMHKLGGPQVIAGSLGAVGFGTPTYATFRHGAAQTPNWELRRKGTLVSSGAYAAAPGTGAASHALISGDNTGPTRWVGRMRAPYMEFPLLTNNELALVQQYILQDTGIAA